MSHPDSLDQRLLPESPGGTVEFEAQRAEILSFDWIVREAEVFYGQSFEQLDENSQHHILELLLQQTGQEVATLGERLGLDQSTLFPSHMAYWKHLDANPDFAEELERLRGHIQKQAEQTRTGLDQAIFERRQKEEREDLAAKRLAVESAVEHYFLDTEAERDLVESVKCALWKESGIPSRQIAVWLGKGETTIRSRIKTFYSLAAEDPETQQLLEETRELVK